MIKDNLTKVSIVVPIYNMTAHIDSAVPLLCEQTYSNIEVILVDDCSTDNSYDKCLQYKKRFNNLYVYRLAKNSGAGAARNYGIEHSSGSWIYFPDIDDRVELRLVERMMEIVSKNKCDLVVFGFESRDSDDNLLYRKTYNNTIMEGDTIREHYENHFDMTDDFGIQGAPWNKFFSMSVISKHAIRYPDLRRHQDEVFIMRYMKYSNTVYFTEDVLYYYKFNNAQDKLRKFTSSYFDIAQKLNEYRKEYIINYNSNNSVIEKRVNSANLYNLLFGLELSVLKYNSFSRFKELVIEYVTVLSKEELVFDGRKMYRKVFFALVRRDQYRAAFYLIKLKLFAENNFSKLLSVMRG